MRFATCVVGLALMLILLPGIAGADGRAQLDGRLWNPYGSQPCDSCLVVLESAGVQVDQTMTDSVGNFHFKNLHLGAYTIRANVEGFQETEFRTDVASGGLSTPVMIYLDPAPIRKKSEPLVVDVSELSGKYPKKAVDLVSKAVKDREKGNTAEATSALEEAVRIAPDFFQAHNELGKAYRMAGRLDDAEREFLAAERLNERSAEPLIQLCGLYIDRNQPELGVKAGEGAVKKDSHSASAFYNLGLAYYRVSRLDSAESVLKKALDLAPTAGQIRLLLANVYLKRQDWHKLRSQLDSYLEENPNGSERAAVEKMREQLPTR